jgi:hypothetical protein
MPPRDIRIADYRQDQPPTGEPLRLLCEDNRGTYLLPFQCEWRDGAWYATGKSAPPPLEAKVVGWRSWFG